MFDKIFIINLKHRTDRKEKILNELQKQKITNYEFFDGIVLRIEDVNSWNPNYCDHISPRDVKNYNKYKIGCLGCLKSHLEIMKLSLSRGYKNVLILEDDCVFEKDFNYMKKSLEKFDKDYNLLYLSGSHLGSKTKITQTIYKITQTLTTGSYIVNETVMKYICDTIIGYNKEIDVFYTDSVQKKFDCYAFVPRVTRQRSGFSDIQQTNVNYKL